MASETDLSDTPYDRIAQWYDVDMARNMRFDDVAFYADFCQREGGRVLELGCGNGRVLLELVCRNIDAVGVDTSRKMLQQLEHKAAARGLEPRACQMDARRLAFGRSFDIVLCPYSLVTYMARPDDLERMLSEVRQVLRADGLLVLDAFIPRDAVTSDDYRLDYRRPFGDEVLARYKRVAQITPRINRIERRYEVVTTDGEVLEALETSEDIRLFSPDELTEALLRSGFSQQQVWWDYGRGSRETDPQFFTVAARRTPAF
jgi:ubiquinone/menaquinone biosynthesis C-methylase UbiE